MLGELFLDGSTSMRKLLIKSNGAVKKLIYYSHKLMEDPNTFIGKTYCSILLNVFYI